MKFTNWKTQYDQYKRYCDQRGFEIESLEKFLLRRRREILTGPGAKNINARETNLFRLKREATWYKQGQPYYKVHPKLVGQLCKTNLSKVPAKFIEVPEPYAAVAIRFAEDHPLLTIQEGLEGVPAGTTIKSILLVRGSNRLEGQHPNWVGFKESVVCFMNLDCYAREKVTGQTQQKFMFLPVWYRRDDESAASAVDSFIVNTKTSDEMKDAASEVFHNCLALAVTIGFLANSTDALIEPDVLNKLKRKYQEANDERRKQLVAKSHRRGKVGYNVGNDMMFLGNVPGRLSKPQGDGEGRGLSYRHIRSGHPHAVRYGPKKEKVKIVWFRPTEVRPDLPFKSE